MAWPTRNSPAHPLLKSSVVLAAQLVLLLANPLVAEGPQLQVQTTNTPASDSPRLQTFMHDVHDDGASKSPAPWVSGPYTPKTDWMAQLPGDLLISELSIPGTHETLSDRGACGICNMETLSDQLIGGLRAFDFRLRHVDDNFEVWHGIYGPLASFDDVLSNCSDFLRDHPHETIVMRVKQTCTCNLVIGCPKCYGNTRSFAETLDAFFTDPRYSLYIYDWPSNDYTFMPTLGETRGKILVLQNFHSDYGVGTGEADRTSPWRDRASCVGDFNDDEYLDLAVINPVSSEVCVFTTSGAAVFDHNDEVLTVPGGSGPASVVSGDLDENGYDDLAVVYRDTDNVGIFLRDENGFQSGILYPVLNIPVSLCAANFDGQPGLDLVVANWGDGGERASMLKNRGDGTFDVVHFSVGNHPWSVTAAHLNDDPYPDLSATHWTNISGDSDYFKAWINDGLGGFIGYDYRNLGDAYHPRQVLAADFDGDGLDELLFGTVSRGVRLYWNNGTGLDGRGGLPSTYSQSLAAGDIDGDSDEDLIVANLDGKSVSVFLNDGSFSFPESYTIPWGIHPNSVSPADFDNDGDLDLAVTEYGPINDLSGGNSIWGIPRMSVMLNHGGGTWGPASPFGPYWEHFDIEDHYQVGGECSTGYGQKWVYVQEHIDKARSEFFPNEVFVTHLSGVCTVTFPPPICRDSPGDIARFTNPLTGQYLLDALNGDERWRCGVIMADFPGDGLIDVIIGHNRFPRSFQIGYTGMSGVSNGSGSWGDYDGDGDLDVLVSGYGAYDMYVTRVYRNDSGTFTDSDAGLPGLNCSAAAWGDYDNDGDLDILLTGQTQSPPQQVSDVYRNDSGSFTDIGAGLIGVDTGSVAWGDYDNDGDHDIVLTGWTGSEETSRVYRNDAGSFTDIGAELPGVSGSSVAWGDHDNDGDLDLLLSGYVDDQTYVTRVYGNDGEGELQSIDADLIGTIKGSVAWGDYDNDGDLDILLTGHTETDGTYPPISKVYRNDMGSFTDINAALPQVSFGSGAWADCDNDGNLDVILTGDTGEGYTTRVYQGDGAGGFHRDYSWLMPLVRGSALPGDHDGDGDLDILLTGYEDSTPASQSIVYENNSVVTNTPPSPPTNLRAEAVGEGAVRFSWDAASDAETPSEALTYNLRVGATPGGDEVLSAMADASTGHRLIPALGNVGHNLSWKLVRPPLHGTYWSVQAIDGALAGSEFASEKVVGVLAVQLEGRTTPSGIELTWGIHATSDIQSLVILRGESDGVLTPREQLESGEAASRGQWLDVEAQWGTTYRYRVSVQTEGVWVDSEEIEVTAGRPEVPERTRLIAAVPNPFNPRTTLRFALANAGGVTLRIFDIAGRQVRDFHFPGLPAGWHETNWDGTDQAGRRVASGSYLVRLEASNRHDQIRVLLLK